MTNRAIVVLVGAGITTAIAVIAAAGKWPCQETLVTSAVGAWILFAVIAATDAITDRIDRSTRQLVQAGDDRHAEDVIEGMRQAATPTPGLRGVR